jgi:hypothetical protein
VRDVRVGSEQRGFFMGGWRGTGTHGRSGERLLARGAAHGTEEKRQPEGSGLRQSGKGLEANSRARYEVRRWSVGLERGRRVGACQVFDKLPSIRARTREADMHNERRCRAR